MLRPYHVITLQRAYHVIGTDHVITLQRADHVITLWRSVVCGLWIRVNEATQSAARDANRSSHCLR
jgi:hypothetical protein